MATDHVDCTEVLPAQHAELLAQKLLDGQLVLFVGAGLSHLAKARDGSGKRMPLWQELMERVASACHEDAEGFDSNPLDLFDAVAYGQDRFTLEEALRQHLDDHPFALSSAHLALAKLPWAAVFTTNYDLLLQRLLNDRPVFEERDYERMSLPAAQRPRLFQIHGTLHRPHTLTREDYRLWPARIRWIDCYIETESPAWYLPAPAVLLCHKLRLKCWNGLRICCLEKKRIPCSGFSMSWRNGRDHCHCP